MSSNKTFIRFWLITVLVSVVVTIAISVHKDEEKDGKYFGEKAYACLVRAMEAEKNNDHETFKENMYHMYRFLHHGKHAAMHEYLRLIDEENKTKRQ